VRQSQFLEVLDRDEAERRWRAAIDTERLAGERLSIADALGRVLAENVRAEVDVTPTAPARHSRFGCASTRRRSRRRWRRRWR
jgi:molybdopterin biosynthesis enzyme